MRSLPGVSELLGLRGEEDAAYECRACGRAFALQYHVCPNCDSYRVERADPWD